MSAVLPELGSKISLISKADIRYEGRLYTVDPQECTIALSSVRSFGTEDRDTQFQIAPQSQIYDYILFRGSDIKDIRVVNSNLSHPNDPAIMQVQLPNGQHLMPHFPMPSMNALPQTALVQPPQHAMNNVYGNPFSGIGGNKNISGGASNGLASVINNPQQGETGSNVTNLPAIQQQPSGGVQTGAPFIMDILAGVSRSTTPISLISRKSPSGDLGGKLNQQKQQGTHLAQNPNNQQQQSHDNMSGSNLTSRDAGNKRHQNHIQRGQQQHLRGNNSNNHFHHGQLQHQARDRRESGLQNNLMDSNNLNNVTYKQQQSHEQQSTRGGQNHYNNYQRGGGNNQNRGWTMHRGQNNSNAILRNRVPTGRNIGVGRMQNQNYRQIAGNVNAGNVNNQNKPRNPKNTIKFEQDFDFEQANNKFEELRSQLSKLKVTEDGKVEQVNAEFDKKDDSGNETGAGEQEHEDEEISVGYDKTKSFFDNISCEAAQDRSKNKKNDWRQERKLNSETFGVSSTRRGGYRGRGGQFYSRGLGNYINDGGNANVGYIRNYRNSNNNYRNRNLRMGVNHREGNLSSNHATATNNNNSTSNVSSTDNNLLKGLEATNANTNAATSASVAAETTTNTMATTTTSSTNNQLKQINNPIDTTPTTADAISINDSNLAATTVNSKTASAALNKDAAAPEIAKGATPKPQQQDGKNSATNSSKNESLQSPVVNNAAVNQ